jgi:hypothetical protein
MRTVVRIVATTWNHLVVAAIPNDEGLRCELRDGRVIAFGPEWRGQISVTDRLYVAQDVTVANRLTPLYLERSGRLDLAQIPITAAAPPKRDRHGRGFVMLDARAGQHGISKVLVTAAQIRDYFFALDRASRWAEQPSWFEVLGVRKNSTPAEIRLAYRVRLLELKTKGNESNRSLQAQLARGLEILLDPDLRRDYLLLLEDPNASVAFPPWTIGLLRATGQKKGELFIVNEFVSFFPSTEERSVRLALRRFRFEGPEAVYRDARKRILIHFDSSSVLRVSGSKSCPEAQFRGASDDAVLIVQNAALELSGRIPAGRVLQDMGIKAAVRDLRYQQIVNKFPTYSRITRTRFAGDRARRGLRVRAQAAALSNRDSTCAFAGAARLTSSWAKRPLKAARS